MPKPVSRRIMLRLSLLTAAVLFLAAFSAAPASAATSAADKSKDAPSTSSTGTVQGYAADKPLQVGTIVQLTGSGASKVTAATYEKAGDMYGVVVDQRKLSITISDASLPNELYVATSGTYDVLVDTQNGPVKAGDYVTISATTGIGMLATPEQKIVFGRAAAGFDGKTNAVGSVDLKDTAGTNRGKAAIGIIPVAIDIRHNPNEKSTKANVPKFLERIGQAVAEKPVGPLRIYLSIGITGISIITAIIILNAGVRNSIISIGRNPLSRKSIFRGLLEIILTSFIILTIGLFAVYLLLKL